MVNGAAFKAAHFNVHGLGMPLLRIRDVGAKSVSTWYDGAWEETHRVRRGDLVVGMDGDFRADVWHLDDALLNQRVCRIDIDERRIEPAFLRLALPGYLDLIWAATSAVTVKHLSSRSIADIPLPMPERQEQRRIVEILEGHLSHLDAAAAEFAGCSRRLDAMWAATLSEARRGQEVPLPEVADVQGGIQKQPRRAPKSNHYPFLRVANVTAAGLSLDDVHRIELFGGELVRLRLEPGDLLVVEGNGSPSQIGRAATWDGSIANCVHQNHLIRVRPRKEILPAYLEAVWNSPEHRRILMDVASSSSGLHTLSVSKLKQLTIPMASLDEQRRVVDRVDEVRTSIRRLEGVVVIATERATSLRRAVLAAAFAGKLTGRHTDQEVIEERADVLDVKEDVAS